MDSRDFLIFKSKLIGIVADIALNVELKTVGNDDKTLEIKVKSGNKEVTYKPYEIYNKINSNNSCEDVLEQFRKEMENKLLTK